MKKINKIRKKLKKIVFFLKKKVLRIKENGLKKISQQKDIINELADSARKQ